MFCKCALSQADQYQLGSQQNLSPTKSIIDAISKTNALNNLQEIDFIINNGVGFLNESGQDDIIKAWISFGIAIIKK